MSIVRCRLRESRRQMLFFERKGTPFRVCCEGLGKGIWGLKCMWLGMGIVGLRCVEEARLEWSGEVFVLEGQGFGEGGAGVDDCFWGGRGGHGAGGLVGGLGEEGVEREWKT